jgi:hypothetical protein
MIHTEILGTFIIHLHIEFHMASFCGSLVIVIKSEINLDFGRPPSCSFALWEGITLTGGAYFCKIYFLKNIFELYIKWR